MYKDTTLDLWLDHIFYTPMKPSREDHFNIDIFIDPYRSSEEYLTFSTSVEGRAILRNEFIDDIPY